MLPNETQGTLFALHKRGGYEIDAILGTNTGTVLLGDEMAHVALFARIAVS